MQMHIHTVLYPFYAPKIMPHVLGVGTGGLGEVKPP